MGGGKCGTGEGKMVTMQFSAAACRYVTAARARGAVSRIQVSPRRRFGFTNGTHSATPADRSFKDGQLKSRLEEGKRPPRQKRDVRGDARETRGRDDVFTFAVSTNSSSREEIFPRFRRRFAARLRATESAVRRNCRQIGTRSIDRARARAPREIPAAGGKRRESCRKRDLKACFFKDAVQIYAALLLAAAST